MTRFRPGAVVAAALVCLFAAAFTPVDSHAAAEVHRLSLMLSGVPTSINGGDFNDAIDYYNATHLAPQQKELLPKVSFSWLFDGELRYFVRPNFAVTAGVSHLRAGHRNEYLPALTQSIDVRSDVITVPVHVGGSYYFSPYNQGDFQARAFLGGGYVQYTHTRASLTQTLTAADSLLTYTMTGSFKQAQTQDAPGYYVEGGAHMFFASRFSALLSLYYRSGELRDMVITENSSTASPLNPTQQFLKPTDKLDVGGVGIKLAVGIGF